MKDKIINLLTDKGTQASVEVSHILMKDPSKITVVNELINSGKAKIKYGSAKTLLILSDRKPELLYPYFNVFVDLLSGKNNILKWTAVDIVSNISFADTDGKIDKKLLNNFFQMISGDSLITAGHVVGNLWKIAVTDKCSADKIAIEMLNYDRANISEECKSILAGHVLESFSKFFDLLSNDKKKDVLELARKQLSSLRVGTRRKANIFIKRFA